MAMIGLLADAGNPSHDLSIFAPSSPSAQAIVNLAILVLAVAVLIFMIVEGVLIYCLVRFRQTAARPATEPPQVYGSQPIEVAWTAAPAVIVLFLTLVTTRTLWEVNASPLEPGQEDSALQVTVVARQWWWEYQYDEYRGRKLGFATANELHIPVSRPGDPRPVRLLLQSADVCHSFWVPRLAGKMDVIPGRTNTLWLQSDRTGLFVGQCAEYCGTQHAGMLLRVVVDAPEDFDRWLTEQMQPAVSDSSVAAGQTALLGQSCVNCHRIRGTPAQGGYAPDLTHLMSRQTLAAGLVENTPQNLSAWLRDPQNIKPGCLMPAFGLGESQQEQIVRYLQTLR